MSYWEDDEDDDANMTMALEHILELASDSNSHEQAQAGGLCPRKSLNEIVLIDDQLWKDYFVEYPVYGELPPSLPYETLTINDAVYE